MKAHDTLTLPTGTTISGTVHLRCVECGAVERVPIQDIYRPNEGDELAGIQQVIDELYQRCSDCRFTERQRRALMHKQRVDE